MDQYTDTESTTFDIQLHLCKQFFNHNKSRQIEIDQITVLQEQNRILKDIQQTIGNRKGKMDEDIDESINLSTHSLQYKPILSMPIKRTLDNNSFWQSKEEKNTSNTTLEQDFKMKRNINTRIISQSEIQKALQDVEQKCEVSTIQIIKHLVYKSSQISKKLRQNQQTIESLQKNKKLCQQLKQIKSELERKIIDYESKVKNLQQQNNSIKQNQQNTRRYSNANIGDKQKQLSKMQIALVLKQKLVTQDMKKLTIKASLIQKQEDSLKQQRQAVQQIWQNIVDRVETPGDQFRATIYTKCKNSLLMQRKQLQEEQDALDMQHEKITKILIQMENIF